ncbi:MAG: DpnD protein [Candidatus Methanofastidiosa archaeon]|nr:DpnD protein [Candidatus Methanofastidiosa archaeon]
MLKEFEIEIKEVLSRVQKVEAESASEAIDRAMEMYYGQEIILDAEDMKGVDFTPMEIQKGNSR